MKSLPKSNNLVALLIAVILIAIGFALAFIHQKSESDEQSTRVPVTTIMDTVPQGTVASTQA